MNAAVSKPIETTLAARNLKRPEYFRLAHVDALTSARVDPTRHAKATNATSKRKDREREKESVSRSDASAMFSYAKRSSDLADRIHLLGRQTRIIGSRNKLARDCRDNRERPQDYGKQLYVKSQTTGGSGHPRPGLGRKLKRAEPDRNRDQGDCEKFLEDWPAGVIRRDPIKLVNLIRQKQHHREKQR